jgi:hypothetical protein
VRTRRVPLTRDAAGPAWTETTVVIRDPYLTRAAWLALYPEIRRDGGTTGRRRLSRDDRVFQRRVHLVARAFGRGLAGGPEPDFEGRFWTVFRRQFPGSPSLQALGKRWRRLKTKLDLGHADLEENTDWPEADDPEDGAR